MNGKPLHQCTSINREARPNLRGEERRKTFFPLMLAHNEFMVENATVRGATLSYQSKKAVTGLILNQRYDFTAVYKDNTHTFPAEIKHIQYDWKSHQHILGIEFKELSEEQEIIMNLLIDPEYSIEISGKQTIDTAHGKISQDD